MGLRVNKLPAMYVLCFIVYSLEMHLWKNFIGHYIAHMLHFNTYCFHDVSLTALF